MSACIPVVISACKKCQIQWPQSLEHKFKVALLQLEFHTVNINDVSFFPDLGYGNGFILIDVGHFSK